MYHFCKTSLKKLKAIRVLVGSDVFLPGVHAVGDNGSKVQKWCNIVGGRFRFGNIRLPVAGSIQYSKDNGKAIEIASEFHAYRQRESMKFRIPETEISNN